MCEKTSNGISEKNTMKPIEEELEQDEIMAASSSSTANEIVDPLAPGKYFHIVQFLCPHRSQADCNCF